MLSRLENKILVVDDEPLVLLMIESILEREGGFVVKTADNGAAALQLMAEFLPDLILLDIQMEGMDGYELCRQIRQQERYRFTKIIMVSACAEVSERLKAYEVGADDYIAKPFDDQEFLAKVRVYQRLKDKEEVDQVKGDLLTLLTHETRTPVNGIIGCCELLLADKDLNEEQRELVKLILGAGQELYQFQENSLLLSKLKAGLELNCSFNSVQQVLENLANEYALEAEERGVTLQRQGDDFALWADWQLLRRALEFVVENGVKFSPDNKSLLLKTEVTSEQCVFIIEDQGPGVEQQRRTTIFEEFSIEDVAHHQQGQGLSLAIASRIMACHGGSIHVEDGHGEAGARFVLKLPIMKELKGEVVEKYIQV